MSRKVQFDIIDIAPAPVLPCLERPDDRVIGAVEVLPCMLVLGGIATTHVSAFQAQTEVDPDIAQLQTYDPGAYKRSQGSSLLTRQFNPLTCAFSCAWPRWSIRFTRMERHFDEANL